MSVLIDAETVKGEMNKKTIQTIQSARGCLASPQQSRWKSRLAFLNRFRSGGLRFANLVQNYVMSKKVCTALRSMGCLRKDS